VESWPEVGKAASAGGASGAGSVAGSVGGGSEKGRDGDGTGNRKSAFLSLLFVFFLGGGFFGLGGSFIFIQTNVKYIYANFLSLPFLSRLAKIDR
jgi:hypothetical protein